MVSSVHADFEEIVTGQVADRAMTACSGQRQADKTRGDLWQLTVGYELACSSDVRGMQAS